jgi:A/G-specific adenine glycosylase
MSQPHPWVNSLLQWFHAHKREMPWRSRRTPYRVWVSEIMLQQTQVTTVTPYFTRFLKAFPTVKSLAAADQQAVLKAWEGLGYYSRARNLHAGAQKVVTQRGGKFPPDATTWRTIPGVGPYTAAAISSICYGEAVPVVDGNVMRVVARFRGLTDDIMKTPTRNAMAAWLQPHIERVNPSDFNEAMMELGALVCTPRSPNCETCPLRTECVARCENLVTVLPVKGAKAKVPHIDVAVAVVRDSRGRILLRCRPDGGMLAGMWELPGGKRQGREPLPEALITAAQQHTGITLEVGERCGTVDHAFSHFRLTLHVFTAKRTSGRVGAGAAGARWITQTELATLPLPTANRKALTLGLNSTTPNR